MSLINFHGPKNVRAIEVLLYLVQSTGLQAVLLGQKLLYTVLPKSAGALHSTDSDERYFIQY